MADETESLTPQEPGEAPGPEAGPDEAESEQETPKPSDMPGAKQPEPSAGEALTDTPKGQDDATPTVDVEAVRREAEDYKARYEALRAEFEELEKKQAELTDQADSAEKVKAELEAANGRVQAVEKQLLRQTVGARYRLPAELVARLSGDDEGAIEEDAKKLATLLGAPRKSSVGKGGLDPTERAFDAKAFVQQYRKRAGLSGI
ncbi:hypothetical protein [Streptomyces cacaoi]|uniref:Scaffolding protein n=1 Tax=Streptomyces cacaoi TaxID=1898 RepID=A0A4Y3R344_STRCI|nr:hypothetical protein [Streptomyces cacaoi]GEB50440.1 hypothetical protein SCA03_29910 [Streptomyces cacaoi]